MAESSHGTGNRRRSALKETPVSSLHSNECHFKTQLSLSSSPVPLVPVVGLSGFSSADISECIWTEVTQNQEDVSYMFDEATPVKACGDLAYNAIGSGTARCPLILYRNVLFAKFGECLSGIIHKEPEKHGCSYIQVKRRRMLQFDSHTVEASLSCGETSSALLRLDEKENTLEDVFADSSQLDLRQQASSDDADQSTDLWLANCLNDSEVNFSHDDDINHTGTPSDVRIDGKEFWNDQVDSDTTCGQQLVTRTTQKIIFRSRKSFISPTPKLASSVTSPFGFIKPCGVHGDITLKDINHRIRTPPPKEPKQNDEDLLASYPTSAFSGKPVVGKMKIRTEGGKGSITVMRTKG